MEVLLVASWWFWIIFAAVVGGLSIFIKNDESGIAAFLCVVVSALMYFFTDAFSGWSPGQLLGAAVAYVAVGVSWMIWKWYSFLIETKEGFVSDYKKMEAKRKADIEKSPDVASQFPPIETLAEYLKDRRPEAWRHKNELVWWSAFWPLSMTWWMVKWPQELFIFIYNKLTGTLDRISERVFS